MELLRTSETDIQLLKARQLMKEALDILDELGEAGDVGPHLDLALCCLEGHLEADGPGIGGAHDLRAAIERKLFAAQARAAELRWQLKPI